MANSRDLVRSDDTLLAPLLSQRFRGGRRRSDADRFLRAQFLRKPGHLDCGESRLESLVASLQAGSVDSLLQTVASQHAKNNRQSRIHLRELQAPRRL